MNTAPKNGRKVLIRDYHDSYVASWQNRYSVSMRGPLEAWWITPDIFIMDGNVRGWMELPEIPEEDLI